MNYDSEFKEIGKKMPYSVPDGYFDGITETTLDKIRHRDKIRRKKILIWRSMAIAASLTALITTAYLLINFLQPEKTRQAAQNIIAKPQTEIQNEVSGQVKESLPGEGYDDDKQIEIKTVNGTMEEVGIADLLTSITGEELLELAAMLNSDMFMNETENILQ